MFRLDLVFLLLSASRLRQCTGIRTSLTGSFFGVPGVNATFDYVVNHHALIFAGRWLMSVSYQGSWRGHLRFNRRQETCRDRGR